MPEISASEAARRFSDLLDAVEHRHERFTVVRRGRVVAQISQATAARGAEIKDLLRGHRRDAEWTEDLAQLRALATIGDRE